MRFEWKAYLLYLVVSLAVLLPLFAPGFVLTLDLVFVPDLEIPENVTSSYLFHAGLHVLNLIIPSEIIEKALLLSILLLSSIGMHRLIRFIAVKKPIDWGIYIASVFFAINPFTYSRFMAGQYAVLLGYALLPWLVRLFILFAREPGLKNALKVGVLTAIIGVLSIHTLGAVFMLVFVGGIVALWQRTQLRKKYLLYGLAAAGIFALLNSYWLVPLLQGQGKTAATITSFTAADTQAFATTGDNMLAKIWNILRLQGFWAEEKNLYLLPQERIIFWNGMSLVIVGLVVTGAVYVWRTRRLLMVWFGMSALIGVIFAAGGIGAWATELPLLAGLREPHKMVTLVALAYSIFLSSGVNVVLEQIRKKSEAFYAGVAVFVLLLPFVFMRVMFWGFDGQLTPRKYPDDWFSVKTELRKDDGAGEILFLPWHQYMTFQFAGRIIASPAPAFFGPRIIASQDPELDGAAGGPKDSRQEKITNLLKTAADQNDLASRLAEQDIRYIMLAKEHDYEHYLFLATQPHLRKISDYPTLVVYENEMWRRP